MKNDCYRYRAVSSRVQSFFMSIPYQNGLCDQFYKIENGMGLNEKHQDDPARN
jgi:hypothetical protein